MDYLKKAAIVAGCGACVALVVGAAVGFVRRGREICESYCGEPCGEDCQPHEGCGCCGSDSAISDEYAGFGCCGGGCAISSDLGDLLPPMPGKLLLMRSDRYTFVAMSTGVTPEQFKEYVLECRRRGFDTPVPCSSHDAATGRPVRDSNMYTDRHNRTLSLHYGKKKGNLLVTLDASGVGAR